MSSVGSAKTSSSLPAASCSCGPPSTVSFTGSVDVHANSGFDYGNVTFSGTFSPGTYSTSDFIWEGRPPGVGVTSPLTGFTQSPVLTGPPGGDGIYAVQLNLYCSTDSDGNSTWYAVAAVSWGNAGANDPIYSTDDCGFSPDPDVDVEADLHCVDGALTGSFTVTVSSCHSSGGGGTITFTLS